MTNIRTGWAGLQAQAIRIRRPARPALTLPTFRYPMVAIQADRAAEAQGLNWRIARCRNDGHRSWRLIHRLAVRRQWIVLVDRRGPVAAGQAISAGGPILARWASDVIALLLQRVQDVDVDGAVCSAAQQLASVAGPAGSQCWSVCRRSLWRVLPAAGSLSARAVDLSTRQPARWSVLPGASAAFSVRRSLA
ncbi:MAG: hypothetical protein R2755_00240 [Acidimicrobiales bacterium]